MVTATDTNGCFDRDTILITVNPLPVITAAGGEFCEDVTVTLSATGGSTYQWTGPGSFSAAVQNPEIINSLPSHSGTYTVSVTDSNGCVATDTALVTVNPLPSAPAVTGNFSCGPGEVTLSASGCSGGIITWYDNQYSNSVVGSGTTFVTNNLDVTQTYFVNCTDTNGCRSFGRVPVRAEIRSVSRAEVLPINSTCIGEVALDNGVLLVTGFRDGEKYSFSEGTTYNPATAIPVPSAVIPENGRIYETIPNPVSAATANYTVEIISVDGCPIYQTIQFERQCEECLPFCEPASIDRVK